LNKDIW
jgi:hypothetical protein